MELVFWAYIAMTVTALLIVGIFHEEPTDIVVNAVLWPAVAVMLLGCLLRDMFDRIVERNQND